VKGKNQPIFVKKSYSPGRGGKKKGKKPAPGKFLSLSVLTEIGWSPFFQAREGLSRGDFSRRKSFTSFARQEGQTVVVSISQMFSRI